MTEQVTRSELATMSPSEVVEARRQGRLAMLAAGQDPGRTEPREYSEGQLSLEDLAGLTPEQVVKSNREGRLEEVKRRNHGYVSD